MVPSIWWLIDATSGEKSNNMINEIHLGLELLIEI